MLQKLRNRIAILLLYSLSNLCWSIPINKECIETIPENDITNVLEHCAVSFPEGGELCLSSDLENIKDKHLNILVDILNQDNCTEKDKRISTLFKLFESNGCSYLKSLVQTLSSTHPKTTIEIFLEYLRKHYYRISIRPYNSLAYAFNNKTNIYTAILACLITNTTSDKVADQWMCPDGRYISNSKRCDGVINCPNIESFAGGDELNCTECKNSGVLCTSQQTCLQSKTRCNNIYNCEDKQDEMMCSCSNLNSNSEFHTIRKFKCRNDYSACTTETFICDTSSNCIDNSDELGCADTSTNKELSKLMYKCKNGDLIDRHRVCDGFSNCLEFDDEKDCALYGVLDDEDHFKGQALKNLNNDDFLCKNGDIIKATKRCDQENNCQDSSDEASCYETYVYNEDQKDLHQRALHSKLFKCNTSGILIPHNKVCDGMFDCAADISDESGCAYNREYARPACEEPPNNTMIVIPSVNNTITLPCSNNTITLPCLSDTINLPCSINGSIIANCKDFCVNSPINPPCLNDTASACEDFCMGIPMPDPSYDNNAITGLLAVTSFAAIAATAVGAYFYTRCKKLTKTLKDINHKNPLLPSDIEEQEDTDSLCIQRIQQNPLLPADIEEQEDTDSLCIQRTQHNPLLPAGIEEQEDTDSLCIQMIQQQTQEN